MVIVPNVEGIMAALEILLQGTSGVITVTRIWQPWEQIASIAQPAIVIVEPTETQTDRRGQQPSLKLEVLLVCYAQVDPADAASAPNTRLNALLAAIRTALLPQGRDVALNAQTLDGLVSNVYVDGQIVKDAGIIDNQGSMLIPVTVLIS